MKNELVSMYETQNKENPLTETQKLFAVIDGYMPERYNVTVPISLYGVTLNIQNYLAYSRFQQFNEECINSYKEVYGEDKFKEMFVVDPIKLYKEIVSNSKAQALSDGLGVTKWDF